MNAVFDAVIIGSGFSGTILGKILAKSGWRIAVLDSSSHPRFAIGESSTPTADFLLAYLADRWRMPELRPLSAWGTWKEKYPEIGCGKKRGFTYFAHTPGHLFRDDPRHSNSLMVAASQSDYWSDTQWLRSDIDAFLAKQCVSSGCELFENVDVQFARRDGDRWSIQLIDRNRGGEQRGLQSRWLIDAGGAGNFSESWLGNRRDDQWMRTQTASVFGHYRNVASFVPQLQLENEIDPVAGFNPDDSAQHHVTDSGWMWMLRFDHGVTSVGIVQPTDRWQPIVSHEDASIKWRNWVANYPSIEQMLQPSHAAEQADPFLKWSNRLSRCRARAVGPGWLQLPTAYAFVDPLHSTGIAHALSGVARLAELLIADGAVDSSSSERWVRYDRQLRQEIEWIDLLVGGCYASLPSFAKWSAFTAWYFIAAIQFERAVALDPSHWPDGYLCCENAELRFKVEACYKQLKTSSECQTIEMIRGGIQPWNDVGLLEPISGQRIPHTAPPKYALPLV